MPPQPMTADDVAEVLEAGLNAVRGKDRHLTAALFAMLQATRAIIAREDGES